MFRPEMKDVVVGVGGNSERVVREVPPDGKRQAG
jgi:hypothetical protein